MDLKTVSALFPNALIALATRTQAKKVNLFWHQVNVSGIGVELSLLLTRLRTSFKISIYHKTGWKKV